jgi:transcriptional regulator with XRE-family HTH domain
MTGRRIHRSGSNVVRFPGVHVGPEIVTSNVTPPGTSEVGALDRHSFFGRDARLKPLGDGLRGNLELPSKCGLGTESLDGALQNFNVAHTVVVHRQFTAVNCDVIDSQPLVDDYGVMKQVPQPENYATFAAWVIALCSWAGSQARVAKEVGVSPQAMTKYRKGGSIEPRTLEKFADYSGVSYAKLRMLVDGKPVSDASQIKDRVNQTRTPLGAQIGRQWEQISDERTRGLIAEHIKQALEQESRLDAATRKRTG